MVYHNKKKNIFFEHFKIFEKEMYNFRFGKQFHIESKAYRKRHIYFSEGSTFTNGSLHFLFINFVDAYGTSNKNHITIFFLFLVYEKGTKVGKEHHQNEQNRTLPLFVDQRT